MSKFEIINSAIVSADVLQRVQLLRAEEARLLLRRQDRRMKIQLVSLYSALFIGISSIIFYDKKMKGLKPASNNKRLWAKRKKFKKQTRLRRLRKQQLTPPKGLQWSEVT